MLDLVFPDVVDQHGTQHPGGGPCGQQAPVNAADVFGAEDIGKVGGNGGESPAVHAHDDGVGDDEQRHAADVARVRHERVEDGAEGEEGEIGVLAPEVVRGRCPHQTAAHVEQAQQADEARRGHGRDHVLEHFLAQDRCLAQYADTCGHIEAKHQPQEPELGRLERLVNVDMALGDHLVLRRRRRPACRPPVGRGDADGEGPDGHGHEVDQPHDDEGLRYAHRNIGFEMIHQCDGERGPDHRPTAESKDGQSGRQPPPVRKPLDEGRNGRHIAQSETDPPQDAVAEIEQPYLVRPDA
ncbi:hypothetical protein D9M70_385540 [compost metagenome]